MRIGRGYSLNLPLLGRETAALGHRAAGRPIDLDLPPSVKLLVKTSPGVNGGIVLRPHPCCLGQRPCRSPRKVGDSAHRSAAQNVEHRVRIKTDSVKTCYQEETQLAVGNQLSAMPAILKFAPTLPPAGSLEERSCVIVGHKHVLSLQGCYEGCKAVVSPAGEVSKETFSAATKALSPSTVTDSGDTVRTSTRPISRRGSKNSACTEDALPSPLCP